MKQTRCFLSVVAILPVSLLLLSCNKATLPDNPDIRPYMNLATSELSFEILKKQIPQPVVVNVKRFKKEHAIPVYPGSIYYLSDVTNNGYYAHITIQEKGKLWSYSGTFYFDSQDKCIAVQYVKSTHKPPQAPSHDWSLTTDRTSVQSQPPVIAPPLMTSK